MRLGFEKLAFLFFDYGRVAFRGRAHQLELVEAGFRILDFVHDTHNHRAEFPLYEFLFCAANKAA